MKRSPDATDDPGRLVRMADCLRHRGPDDYGYLLANSETGSTWCGQSIAADIAADVLVASRRLSILDLSAEGRQPMTNDAGDICVVFNGAIHNYKELQRELEGLGHVFHSHTDTEVIVHAYEAWGVDCAQRFNGMWAYAIWDGRARRLICSRDRFGIKPLYVAPRPDAFFFASEVKAILAAGVEPHFDPAAAAKFLALGRLDPARETLFAGITPLPAGHTLVVTGTGLEDRAYWTYAGHRSSYDYSNPAETFRELFADSVHIRLRSDVPVGILLSGGLDSSAVTAFASRESRGLTAFTAIFPGFPDDERQYAELVAARSGVPLECVEYRPDRLVDDLSDVIWHMETPPLGGQVLARWSLLRAASEHVKVVLEGQGADEMLAGYREMYLKPYVLDELAALRPASLASRLMSLAPALQLAASEKAGNVIGAAGAALAAVSRSGSRPADHDLLSRELARCPLPGPTSLTPRGPFDDHLTNALWADHSRRILPHLLNYGDSISMAHSVESRVPFLDHRLVEFVFGLPFDSKMHGRQTKWILRQALSADIPAEILNRRTKVGFATPLREWLRSDFRRAVRPLLESQQTRERGWFSPPALRSLLDAFQAGRAVDEKLVLRCLALELWARLFVDGDGLRTRVLAEASART